MTVKGVEVWETVSGLVVEASGKEEAALGSQQEPDRNRFPIAGSTSVPRGTPSLCRSRRHSQRMGRSLCRSSGDREQGSSSMTAVERALEQVLGRARGLVVEASGKEEAALGSQQEPDRNRFPIAGSTSVPRGTPSLCRSRRHSQRMGRSLCRSSGGREKGSSSMTVEEEAGAAAEQQL